MMPFHRPGAYAAFFGLDTDNAWKVGGWSMGATSYKLYHEGNKPTKSDVGLPNADNTSDVNKPISTATQNALNTKLNLSGGTMSGNLIMNKDAPTIYFQDTNEMSAMIHCNGNLLYVLRGGVNTTTWTQVNGQWPLTINLADNNVTAGGNLYARGGTLVWDQGNLVNVSQLANNSGYITSGGRAYPRNTSNGGDMNFNWSGQGGQPNWLWGGNDGVNYYVYNPSNFDVNRSNKLTASDYGSPPHYALRAWVNFNGVGVVSIRASGNVSSITDNGTGQYTVNFSTAMPDVNYSAVASFNQNNGVENPRACTVRNYNTTSVQVVSHRPETAGDYSDQGIVSLIVTR
jgi:hypothetical protein